MSATKNADVALVVQDYGATESPFTPAQEAYLRKLCGAMFLEACNQNVPFPFQQAQRYIERVAPTMIAAVIETEMAGIIRETKNALADAGESIMMGRIEEVRQRVNDWMDKAMRTHVAGAQAHVEKTVAEMGHWVVAAEGRMTNKLARAEALFTWRYWWRRAVRKAWRRG